MVLLDIETILITNIAISLICAVLLALLWHQYHKRYAGLSFWAADFALQTLVSLLIALRGQIPDSMSIVLANMLIIGGTILLYIGLERFFGERSSQIHNYFLLAVFASVHAYFTFFRPSLAMRNLNLSMGLLIMSLQILWLVLRRIELPYRPLAAGTVTVFAAYSLISLCRIPLILFGPQQSNDLLRSGNLDAIIVSMLMLLLVVLAYSLTFMVSKRLLMDIRTQEEKFVKAFRSSPNAIIISRKEDGKIIEMNDGFERMSGYSYKDIIGKTTVELHLWTHEIDRGKILKKLAKDGRICGEEVSFRKKGGKTMCGLFFAECITINNEPCVLSTITDITDIKRSNDMLRKSSEELERFNKIAVDRELKMIELKKAIKGLKGKHQVG